MLFSLRSVLIVSIHGEITQSSVVSIKTAKANEMVANTMEYEQFVFL